MSRVVASQHEVDPGSPKSYTVGFILSLLLTLVAYLTASKQWATNWTLIYILVILAIFQLFVQLVFFLHLGRGSRSRWNLTAFCFAAMVVLILVAGSLWIMKNLNYAHDSLTPGQLNNSIIKDEGIKPSSY